MVLCRSTAAPLGEGGGSFQLLRFFLQYSVPFPPSCGKPHSPGVVLEMWACPMTIVSRLDIPFTFFTLHGQQEHATGRTMTIRLLSSGVTLQRQRSIRILRSLFPSPMVQAIHPRCQQRRSVSHAQQECLQISTETADSFSPRPSTPRFPLFFKKNV